MKDKNLIYAAMGFVLAWTVILCFYHVKVKEIDAGTVASIPQVSSMIGENRSERKKSFW